MHLLGIDLGTTAIKLVVLDPDGRVAGRASRATSFRADAAGRYEQDPEDWWRALQRAAGDLAGASAALEQVGAVGLSGQTHGLVLADARGAPVRPCLTWADQRAVAETAELVRDVGARVRDRCANPLIEAFTLPKLLWVARHEPEALARAAVLGLPKDFLRHRLTGRWETDRTDAASTLLYDIWEERWDDELVRAAGATTALLPPVRRSTDVAGPLLDDAAAALGVPAGVPVVTGASDVACAALGSGVDEPGLISINLGTAAQLMAPVNEPVEATYTFLGAGAHGLLAMSSVYAAGRSLDWLLDDLLLGPLGAHGAAEDTRHDDVDDVAASVAPGADGLLFLPHLLGASTPWMDAQARGALLGMTPAHGQPEIVRAVMEGVALAIRVALERLAPERAGRRIRLGGGPARSPVWTRIVADACAVDLEIVGGDSSAIGAAMLAGIGSGAFRDAGHAIARCVQVLHRIAPDPDAAAVYAAQAQRFRRACDALAPVFRGIPSP